VRVVLDTNVLLSGLLMRGVCEAVLDACLGSDEHTVVLSEHILREFARQAETKFRIPASDVEETLHFLRTRVQVVLPVSIADGTCRDPDDLPVLGTLLAADADCLVTGDADLLSLGAFEGRPIVSPRRLLQRLV
jgi:putative PIN family toxin of toxin-antitoxin system